MREVEWTGDVISSSVQTVGVCVFECLLLAGMHQYWRSRHRKQRVGGAHVSTGTPLSGHCGKRSRKSLSGSIPVRRNTFHRLRRADTGIDSGAIHVVVA